ANLDFYILLLASLNRAMFWFSPLAWWQLSRMAELAEIISDGQAIDVLGDRLSYAELLLELVQNVRPNIRSRPIGLQMARAGTGGGRIERILAAAPTRWNVGRRTRLWTAVAIVPLVVVSAGSIAYRTLPAPELALEDAADPMPAKRRPQHVDFYAVAP